MIEQRQRGIALIAVLLLLVFVLSIVAGLFYRHQIHIQKVTRGLAGEQALLLLLGAENWALSVLERDGGNAVDHLGENWARGLPPVPVEGGSLSGCLDDLQGRLNLNNLGLYSIQGWQDELAAEPVSGMVSTRRILLRRLLEQLGRDASDARIAALVDWLDADAWLLTPDSAEDNEYLLLTPPYRAANQGLVETSELTLVKGFDSADVAALEPWVSTLPEVTPINVNTAPPQVLMTLSPLISAEVAQRLMARRPFAVVGDFYSALAELVRETRETLLEWLPAEFVAVDSGYFQLRAEVHFGAARMAYSSLIQRRQGEGARVLQRSLRSIPALAQGAVPATSNLCTSLP